jgi:drug/metabolite transporter (DMT)-like permease
LTGITFSNDSLYGLGLCFLGTFVASLSNTLSVSNQKQKMPIVQTNDWATGYLALFGSVIVFGIYLHLLGKIGANKTSRFTIITPEIAVVISSVVEDFTFTTYTVGGLVLILAGNVTVLLKSKACSTAGSFCKKSGCLT